MIAKFNNIRPENFERLSRFIESDLNYVRVTRQPESEEKSDEEEDLDPKRDRVRIAKIINFGKDEKAYHTAMYVDVIVKDWVIDYLEIPGKGWKRIKLPIPRELVDIIFDCLGVMPTEVESVSAGIDDPAIAQHVRKRFDEIADHLAEERVPTEPMSQ